MDVLHRTTKELRRSVNEPDYQLEDWIHGPDLSAVAGYDSRYWVISGDTVSLATGAIEAEVLAEAKAAKIAAIDAKTSQLIEDGRVTVNGEDISTRLTAQVSLTALQNLVSLGIASFPQEWSATDGQTYAITSQADFVRIAGIVTTFVMVKKAAGRALRFQVLACTTVAQVNAIVDDRS